MSKQRLTWSGNTEAYKQCHDAFAHMKRQAKLRAELKAAKKKRKRRHIRKRRDGSPVKDAYKEYMRSPAWQVRRECSLNLAGRKCQKCGTDKKLEVHHLTYKRLGYERDSDLKVLCKDCHYDAHLANALRMSVEQMEQMMAQI